MTYWDSLAGDDPQTMIRHGDWAEGIEADLSHLEDVGDAGPVLDLGCGIGRLSVAYARWHAVEVIGVDVSPLMLVRAERDDRVCYLSCDGRTLPHLPELGGAFSVLMFQHVPASVQASYVAQVAERLTVTTYLTHPIFGVYGLAFGEYRLRMSDQPSKADPDSSNGDSPADDGSRTAFERFEDFARKIIAVPKREIDELRHRDQN